MQLNLDSNNSRTSITAYSEKGVCIGGRWHNHHLLLTTEKIIDGWKPPAVNRLTIEHLDPVLNAQPEVLILGSGRQIVFPPRALYINLAAKGIGLEVMNTEAACRTFDILLNEARAVAAALYLEI